MRFSTTLYSILIVLAGSVGVAYSGVDGFSLLPAAVAAQVVEVDEGTFVVELGGRPVGTETFRIRRSGFGDNTRTIAQGTLDIVEDGTQHTVQSVLATLGVGMFLDAYQVEVSRPVELSVRLRRSGNRMVSETSSEAGVEEREYRRAQSQTPTVVLDRFLAHHYFFVAPYQSPTEINLSAILPRPGGQLSGALRMIGVEPITVGDVTIQAQRLEIRLDGTVRDIWLDGQNRVLRVEIPSQDYVARRRDPPPG
jgi:hypothetical protein